MAYQIYSGDFVTFVREGGIPVTYVKYGGTPILADREAELPEEIKEELGY